MDQKIFYSEEEIDSKETEFSSFLSKVKETVSEFKEKIPKIQ